MGVEPVLDTNLSKFVPWLRNRLCTLVIIYSITIFLCCRIQSCDPQNPNANSQLLSDQISVVSQTAEGMRHFLLSACTWGPLNCCCCSVAKSCPTLCDPMDCSTPAFLFTISWSLLKLIHGVGDVILPSHPLLSPSPPAFNLSQHQDLFRVSSLHQVAKVMEFQLQHQSFQWIFRTNFL